MVKLSQVFLLLSLSFSIGAKAEFLQSDVLLDGDEGAMYDTATNLEWLKLGTTANYTYNQVSARTNGGDLDGWRFATESEVVGLMKRAFPMMSYNNTDYAYTDTSALPAIDTWFEYMGISGTWSGYDISYGVYRRNDGALAASGAGRHVPGRTIYDYDAPGFTNTFKANYYGFFLVSDGDLTLSSINGEFDVYESVPIAGSGVLALTALLGSRRKKKIEKVSAVRH